MIDLSSLIAVGLSNGKPFTDRLKRTQKNCRQKHRQCTIFKWFSIEMYLHSVLSIAYFHQWPLGRSSDIVL